MTTHELAPGENCAQPDCSDHPFVLDASDGSGFAHNALRFATAEDAARYGRDLAGRWLALRAYRVVDTRDDSVSDEIDLF